MPTVTINAPASIKQKAKLNPNQKILSTSAGNIPGLQQDLTLFPESVLQLMRSAFNRSGSTLLAIGSEVSSFSTSEIVTTDGFLCTHQDIYFKEALTITPTAEAHWGIIEIELVADEANAQSLEFYNSSTRSVFSSIVNTRFRYSVKVYEKYNTTPEYPAVTVGRFEWLRYVKDNPFGDITEVTNLFTSNRIITSVVDNLNDNSVISALSANQGVQLKNLINKASKSLGEVFFLSEIKAASSDFPAICLAQNNATLWKSANPLGAGNIPGNFPDLVDYFRAIPLRFDPLNGNNTDFTVSSWSYSGGTITVTFAYTTPKGTKESKVIRSLHEDAFVHNSNTNVGVVYSAFENVTSWRTITLVDPLRDDADGVQVPAGTYQITAIAGGESGAAQIKFVHSATPSGTPKVESRITRFYPYRIQDAGQNSSVNAAITALHFAVQGRGFVTVDNATNSEWVGGLRRRDRTQGHRHPIISEAIDRRFEDGLTYSGATKTSTDTYQGTAAGNITTNNAVGDPVSNGINGTPRADNTTDSRGLGLYPYIWAKTYA